MFHISKLAKSLDGFKQKFCAWFQKLNDALCQLDFSGSKTNSSLFIYHQGNTILYIIVYVDNLTITRNSFTTIQFIIDALGRKFTIKDRGVLHYFLRIKVHKITKGYFFLKIDSFMIYY